MGFNPNNLNAQYDKMFGAGAYNSGIQQAQNSGRLKTQADFAKQQFLANYNKKLNAPNKTFQDALNFWNDPSNKQDLLQNGAYKTAENLKNDPLAQENLKGQGFNVQDLVDAAYNASSNGKFASERAYNQYSGQLNKDTQASNKARDKQYQDQYGMNYQDYYDKVQKPAMEAQQKSQQQGSGNERTGFLGFLDSTLGRLSNTATELALGKGFNDAQNQNYQNLTNYQLKQNPNDQKAKQAQQMLNTVTRAPKNNLEKASDFVGAAAGVTAPYLVGDGLLGTAGKALPVLDATKLVANPYGKLAIQGAGSGLAGSGIDMGTKAIASGQQFTPGDIAKNLAINGAAGGALNPLAHGIISNLNLKGQLGKVLDGSHPYNAETFQQALKDAFEPRGNVSNVVADKNPVLPKPFEPQYPNLTLPLKPAKEPVNLQGHDWLGFAQSGKSTPTARGWIPDPTVSKGQNEAIRGLADNALNRANAFTNAPEEGFNQRLLNVQHDMHGLNQTNKNVQKEYQGAVQQQYDYLKNSMKKGVDSGTTSNGLAGNFKEVNGRYTVSNNPQWYQDFYKQNGRPPSNKELRQMAEEQVRNGFQDQLGNLPAWKPQDLQHIHDQMDEIQTMLQAHPEQATQLSPILEGLKQDEARLTQGFNNVLSGNKPGINDLYTSAKGANDPKNFDELIKLAQMEHNAANPSLTSLLRSDPKIQEALDKLNALGKTSKKNLIPAVGAKPKNMGLKIPDVGSKTQNPHDLLQALQANEKPGGGKGLLMSLNPGLLKTVKTSKNLSSMSKGELQNVMQQLEEKQSVLSKGGNKKQIEAVKEDMKKVSDLLMKLDLQQFGKNVPKPKAGNTNINPAPKVDEITSPNPEDGHGYGLVDLTAPSEEATKALQQSKDIMPNQTLTKNIYELADRLPKEMGDNIKSQLDAAKEAHVNNLEQRSNDLYDKVVKELGIKKGSKESALVQDFGEKTLGKKALREQGIDPSKVSKEELDKINLQQLKELRPNDWQKLVEADNYFRDNYKKMIDEVNNTVKEIYPNNPDKIVPERQDYYHHFNELQGFEGFKNLIQNSAAIDPHLAGISPHTKPNSKWQAFKQMRGNGAYKSDAVGGYLKYLQAASHSTHIDPMIKVLRQSAEQIANATEGTKNLNNLKTALEVHADNLSGKTNPIDRLFQDHIIGRKAMQAINVVNGHIKKNMILGNLGSALGQIGNVPLTLGKAKQFAGQGLIDTLQYAAKNLPGSEKNLSVPINQSQFLKERFSSDYFKRFDTGLLKNTEKMGAWLLETADKAGTYFAWNSMYRKGLAQGVEDPIKFADNETRQIIAGRGVGEVPIAQKAKITQLVAPFSLEVGNQWKVLGKQMSEKDFTGVITFLAASYGLNEAMNRIKGSDVSYNPVKAVLDGINKDPNASALDKGKSALANLAGETVGNIPGGAYIPQIMGLTNPNAKQAIFGNRAPDRFGTGVGVTSTVFKPITDSIQQNWGQAGKDALPLLLPFGGNQVKKTYTGIDALAKGGSYDSKGNLQYPVDSSNPSDLLHSLLLGPTTTAQGQKYYNNNQKALSAKQTQQYENAPNKQDYYNKVLFQRQAQAIQKKIKDTAKDQSLSPQEKQQNILVLMQQLQNLQK